ncbi:MAG: dephospho-CoA kinase [Clostridia bacterium]|nr:dephospho-CoA kinase [Clostridia bacterium]
MIIGITGRMATGKSTAASIISKKGFLLIDADSLYHGLRESSDEMKEDLIEEFGGLSSAMIFRQIKDDRQKKKRLDEITHKYVAAEIKRIVGGNSGKNIVIDAPVPVREGFLDICDVILVTDCEIECQVERLGSRNGISKREALERMGIQDGRDYYTALGDLVVDTGRMDENDLRIVLDIFLGDRGGKAS